MENLSEISGYVASTLVLLTFVAKDMRLLRTVGRRTATGAPGRGALGRGIPQARRTVEIGPK